MAAATQASIDDWNNSQSELSIAKCMTELTDDSATMNSFRHVFAKHDRTGYTNEEVIYKDETEIFDFICPICQEVPFDVKHCSTCYRYYCNACLNREKEANNGCTLRPRPGYLDRFNGYEEHTLTALTVPERKIFDKIKIQCIYGCTERITRADGRKSTEPRKFSYWDANSHFVSNICPSSICTVCDLLQYNDKHKQNRDCIHESRRFSTFLAATIKFKQSIWEKKERDYVDRIKQLENKLQNCELDKATAEKQTKHWQDEYLNLSTSNSQLNDNKLQMYMAITNERLFDMETKVKTLRREPNRPSEIQTSDCDFRFVVDPNDEQYRPHDPILWATFQNHGRRPIDLSTAGEVVTRNHSWREVKKLALKVWGLTEKERDYDLVDFRIKVRTNLDEKLAQHARNVFSVNLVPRNTFRRHEAYLLNVSGYSYLHNHRTVSAEQYGVRFSRNEMESLRESENSSAHPSHQRPNDRS